MAKDAFWQAHRIKPAKPGAALRVRQLAQAEKAAASMEPVVALPFTGKAAQAEADRQALNDRVQRARNALARQDALNKKE